MESVIKDLFPGGMRIIDDHTYEKDKTADIDIRKFLPQFPIFSGLDEKTIDVVYNSGIKKKYTKGKIILFENELGSAVYLVIKGQLKVSRFEEMGGEIIITILKEKDFFGEMSVLDEAEHSASITANEDTILFIIPGKEFHKLLHEHHGISMSMIKEMIKRLRSTDAKIKALSINNSEGKVAALLKDLISTSGMINDNKAEIIKVPVQHEMANMIGTSRETISRTLNKFIKEGLIEFDGDKIVISDYRSFIELYE